MEYEKYLLCIEFLIGPEDSGPLHLQSIEMPE